MRGSVKRRAGKPARKMVTNMIIECKIELDWIGDGSVDEKIQARIVKAAVDQVGASIAKRVDDLAVEILDTRVNAMIDDIWANFIDKRVNLTDKYGDTVESYDSVKDMLKARLDGFLNQQVDKDGKVIPVGKCGYNTTNRINWMMENIVNKHTESFMKQVQVDLYSKLKATLDKSLKETISASMLKTVDVSSLINAAKG